MATDRALPPRSSLIEYIQVFELRNLLEPIRTEIKFNLIGENHHLKHILPPHKGHKCVNLMYPNPKHVRFILETVKGPSVLYLRGCDQLWDGGHFPFENLKTLAALEISGIGNLTTLPKQISEMNQLQTLYLSHLSIQHFPADDFFSKLANLRSLVLKACPNLHSLPKLSTLTALESLDLSRLLLEAFPDGFFSDMKKLRKLILSGCSNLHSLPAIEALESLEFLDISYTILHCTTHPLAYNPTLTHVICGYAKGSMYDYLVHQIHIRVLDLSGAHHLGGTFQLRDFTFLRALDLSRTNIESIDVRPPTSCHSCLEILLLRNCSSLVQLSAMKDLKSLRVFNLSGCESLCVLPEDLCNLVNLQELNLSKTNLKHLPSFANLISFRTRLILPRRLVLQVPELSSIIESKNLSTVVIVEDDVASPDLGEIVDTRECSIPNEFHLVSTFTNTDSSFYRFKHEFGWVKDRILDIESEVEANSIVPKGSGTFLVDLEYILENIDLLESADHKGNARKLLDRLMEGVDTLRPKNSLSLKELLRLVVKLKLLLPCPKQEDFDLKEMNYDGNDSDEDYVARRTDLSPRMSEWLNFLHSYDSLTIAQRSCLLYLSIFPLESHSVRIKERILIQLWHGEGFIDEARHEKNVALSSRASSSTNTNPPPISSADTIDEIGRRIMLILEEKGFIKRSDDSGTCFISYTEHCLIRDKANEEGFILLNEDFPKLIPELTSGSERAFLLDSQDICPSSCQLWLDYANTCQKLECFRNIRTLFNVNERTLDLRVEWLSKMRNLHMLHLGTWESENKYIEVVDLKFLEELKNMKQLRVLSFEGVAGITKLPDSVCQLTLLEILNLRECSQMEELPDGIGSLQNLSHLDVTNCPLLSMLPKGIELLSNLEVLKGYLITYNADVQQNKKACTLADLLKLEKLRKLNLVVNLSKFPCSEDLQVFKEMKNLCNLKITWLRNHYIDQETQNVITRKASRHSRWQRLKCWEQHTPQNDEAEEPVMIKNICALENIKKLVLCCFPSETTPDWFHPSELPNLEKLRILGGHLKTIPGDPINNTWTVKSLHLKYTLKLDINWESLVQYFPSMTFLIKIPKDHLSTFPVDVDTGVWTSKAETLGRR